MLSSSSSSSSSQKGCNGGYFGKNEIRPLLLFRRFFAVLFIILTQMVLYPSSSFWFCSARDCHTSFRRAWRDLSCQEQDEFLEAIALVKQSGVYDEFVDVHLNTAMFTHGPAEFLPWHRYVHELVLLLLL